MNVKSNVLFRNCLAVEESVLDLLMQLNLLVEIANHFLFNVRVEGATADSGAADGTTLTVLNALSVLKVKGIN